MRRLPLALLLAAGTASAHGGLPISEAIVPRDGLLVVPTKYWGVFLGNETTPWRWICEEAINKKQDRRWTLTGDGTYHVTDYAGVTSSRDGGCTWVGATGELAKRFASAVVADPVDGKRAWATTGEGSAVPWNALFTTTDDGVTWTPVLQEDEYLRGVALSSDGQTLYVTGAARAMGPVTVNLHVSTDGGKNFTDSPLDYQFDVGDGGLLTPSQVEPIAVDPADPSVAYLRVIVDPERILLRAEQHGAKVTEILRVEGDIGGLAFDPARGTLLVATQKGLYRATGGGALAPAGNLTQSQCVIVEGKAVYACGWNYAPDFAAIARSDDGGDHFTSIFQYAQTVGPVTSCPASTPVGQVCPGVWSMYAAQLGIDVGNDMGVVQMPPPATGCSCDVGSGAGTKTGTGTGAMVLLAIALYLRRKAARPA